MIKNLLNVPTPTVPVPTSTSTSINVGQILRVIGFWGIFSNFGESGWKAIIPIYREACTNALEQSKQAREIISQCESERKRIESEADAERKPLENKIRTTNNLADTIVKHLKDKTTKEKAKRAFSAAVLKADDVVKKTNNFLSDPFAGTREFVNKREPEENEIRAEEARKAKEAKKNKNKK